MADLKEILSVALTALLSIAALFIIAKLIGHRQISQLGVFDYINGITIGSIAAEMATELEKPWLPLTALVVYGLAAWGLSLVLSKHARTRKYIDGSPTIIFDNGQLYRENLKKTKLDLSEFMCMCRQAGYFDLADIQTAVFEYNGLMTFLPASTRRPVNPQDMDLTPAPAHIGVEVIMDGRILGENLHRMGLDEHWLEKNIQSQGFKSAKEVFLGICYSDKNLALYKSRQEK